MAGRVQYAYITPAFSRSPYWGEINMATPPYLLGVSMVGINQATKKMFGVEMGGLFAPHVHRALLLLCLSQIQSPNSTLPNEASDWEMWMTVVLGSDGKLDFHQHRGSKNFWKDARCQKICIP